jgi:hypothetical protein
MSRCYIPSSPCRVRGGSGTALLYACAYVREPTPFDRFWINLSMISGGGGSRAECDLHLIASRDITSLVVIPILGP